jgi:hypothetical protein
LKNILLLTTLNLSSNPRLKKEIALLSHKGFSLTVVAFKLGNWSDKLDNQFISKYPSVNYHFLSATRKPFIPWLKSTVAEFALRRLPIRNNLKLQAYASNKRAILLSAYLKKFKPDYDFIIGHNLGALEVAQRFAKKWNIPFGFDVEDYHPGESISVDSYNEKLRREILMKSLLPKASYVSFASPLIMKETIRLCGSHDLKNPIVIYNSFSATEFKVPEASTNYKLRLVWFSQNIAAGRGLEYFLPALEKFSDELEVTLIGKLNPNFSEYLNRFNCVTILPPLSQDKLHSSLQYYDVGLAIDIAHADYNRELALTNKIITYRQAGLYIFATITKAQHAFLAENPGVGIAVNPENSDELNFTIRDLLAKKSVIRAQAPTRFQSGINFSWEREKSKLLSILPA